MRQLTLLTLLLLTPLYARDAQDLPKHRSAS